MAQLTIYLDESTLKQIEKTAKREKSSISNWVKRRITFFLKREWPPEFLATLGSLNENELARPEQPPFGDDAARESL